MILVVGATGHLGGQIARALLARGHEVRVLVRPGSTFAPLVRAGAVPVTGDLKDPPSLERACRGIDTIVITAHSMLRAPIDTVETVELAGYASLIAAAAAAGVSHFVYTSALGVDETSPVPFVAAKGLTERRVRASGMPWTTLAPAPFMDEWLPMLVTGPTLAGREIVFMGSGKGRNPFVHTRDITAFAVAAVEETGAVGRRLPISGREAHSLRDVCAIVERALGRPLQIRGVAPGEEVPEWRPSSPASC